ncbi:hypothetical protein NN561_018633 [Cricetulus griseus]
MIKGEVSAGSEWREPRQLPAAGARAPPGWVGAGDSAAGGTRCLGGTTRRAERGAGMVLLFHPWESVPAPFLWPDAGVPYLPEGSKSDLGRYTLVRQLVRPACSCGSSILGR